MEDKKQLTDSHGLPRNANGTFQKGHAYSQKHPHFLKSLWRKELIPLLEAKEIREKMVIVKPNGETEIRNFEFKTENSVIRCLCIALIAKAFGGDVTAMNVLMDRTVGKAPQQIDMKTDDQPKPIQLTDEEKVVMLRALERHRKENKINETRMENRKTED